MRQPVINPRRFQHFLNSPTSREDVSQLLLLEQSTPKFPPDMYEEMCSSLGVLKKVFGRASHVDLGTKVNDEAIKTHGVHREIH